MTKRNIPNIKKYIKKYKKRSIRHRALIAVAALVVFCTTYALILPAITMEGKVNCGKEEHIHKHSCYTKEKSLVCKIEEGKIHSHEENCYNNNGDLICKADTSVVHTHTDECYTTKMVMACQKIMHEHTSSCLENVNQATETATAVTDKLTSETINQLPTELATQEISKLDNEKSEAKSGADNASEIKDLKNYLSEIIKVGDEFVPRGEVSHTVSDSDGQPVVDTTMVSGEGYLLTLNINAYGIEPGTYQYSLPAEIYLPVDSYTGKVTSGSESTGDYSAKRDATVVITIIFDKSINDNQNFEGMIEFTINLDNGGEEPLDPAISKEGAFNEADGMFDFKINATIPSNNGNDLFKEWYIYDESRVPGSVSWTQSLENSVINITYNEKAENGEVVPNTYPVKKITEVTATDNIAYICSDKNGSDCLYLVNRCRCNESLCGHMYISDEGEALCESVAEEFGEEYSAYSEWCTCWNLNKNATLSIEYKNNKNNKNTELIQAHPGKNYVNDVSLVNVANDDDTVTTSVSVPIPNLVEKSLTKNFDLNNNYRGQYTIYVNKSKIDLSKVDSNNDGVADTEVLIKDTMANVAYIPGSISITATNAENVSEQLEYGTDYEINYTPGSQDPLVAYNSSIDITLKKLGAYTYTITYNGQAVSNKPEGTAVNMKTSNTATVMVYSYPSDTVNFNCYFRQGWSYLKRILTIEKVDAEDGKLLPGAVYGLYTEDGYEIAQGTTDGNGLYDFKTNVREGIIFQEGVAYYVKELVAPKDYTLDAKEYWFYFAEEEIEALKIHSNIMMCGLDDDGSDNFNKMVRTNEKGLKLPETGGCGTVIYTIAGLVLICGSAYVLYKKYLFWKRGA